MHPSEDPALRPSGQVVVVDADGLPALFDALRGRGYSGRPYRPGRRDHGGSTPCSACVRVMCAVGILDEVLTAGRHADPVYRGRRDGVFIIAVECTEPGATCFCTSMGCGPGAESGFDLAMTELVDSEGAGSS